MAQGVVHIDQYLAVIAYAGGRELQPAGEIFRDFRTGVAIVAELEQRKRERQMSAFRAHRDPPRVARGRELLRGREVR